MENKNFAMFIPLTINKQEESKMYSTIDDLMNDSPYKYNWCEAGVCACSGCINIIVIKHGFTQEIWQDWVNRNPDTTPKQIGYGFESYTYKTKQNKKRE